MYLTIFKENDNMPRKVKNTFGGCNQEQEQLIRHSDLLPQLHH